MFHRAPGPGGAARDEHELQRVADYVYAMHDAVAASGFWDLHAGKEGEGRGGGGAGWGLREGGEYKCTTSVQVYNY